MKNMKKFVALGLATAMVATSFAGCGDAAQSSAPADDQAAASEATGEATPSAAVAGDGIAPDAEGTAAKWSEEKTADGWMKVTNEGGKTLGYSTESGVEIIQVDGLAFKDLDRDGELDVYEDWRNSDEDRARDLTNKLSEEEMTPLFTHGGWTSFGQSIEGDDLTYIEEGGRGGVTRSATVEGNTGMAVSWVNALQSLCEATGNWGIPATISVDPSHESKTIDNNTLAATMSTEEAFNLGVLHGKQYRAVGVSMLLGPQIDIGTQPTWCRASGTFSEDPALNRDLANAYISGLQSTWAEDGTDLGWGEDSVYAIAKHYVGAGASEGGRNDHMDVGKYTVFPGNNFEAHLIPFLDGAFNLSMSSTKEAGVMPNYAISYTKDGSLGELVGGGYSEYKLGLLQEAGYDGFILTDWQITNDGQQCFGVEDYTMAERFMLLYKAGVHQVGGTSDNEAAAEGYELLQDEIGDEEALATLQNATYHFLKSQMQSGLFENAYITEENAFASVWNNETDELAKAQQEKSIIMLKNSDGTIAENNGEKKTVYIPYIFTPHEAAAYESSGATYASWDPAFNIEVASKYFNVVTDTLADPSAEAEDGTLEYAESDLTRASAADVASCDMILVAMDAPSQDSALGEDGTWYPASIQYSEYTADNARRESIAGDIETETINDGYYGTKTQDTKQNRSYAKNTVGQDSKYAQLELLQYLDGVKGSANIVVAMYNGSGPAAMIWSEVEPIADAILYIYGDNSWILDEAVLDLVDGQAEPSALLPYQQPASMDAVEAQNEDVPRDCECYVDADGNTYDFAFGLNWAGVISDERTATYGQEALTTVNAIQYHTAE